MGHLHNNRKGRTARVTPTWCQKPEAKRSNPQGKQEAEMANWKPGETAATPISFPPRHWSTSSNKTLPPKGSTANQNSANCLNVITLQHWRKKVKAETMNRECTPRPRGATGKPQTTLSKSHLLYGQDEAVLCFEHIVLWMQTVQVPLGRQGAHHCLPCHIVHDPFLRWSSSIETEPLSLFWPKMASMWQIPNSLVFVLGTLGLSFSSFSWFNFPGSWIH